MLQLQQTQRYSVLAAAPPAVTVALLPDDPMLDEEARAAEAEARAAEAEARCIGAASRQI